MTRGFQAVAALYERRLVISAVIDRRYNQNRNFIPP
jgi:hypothetical protein